MATTVMSQQIFLNFSEIQGIATACLRLHPADHNAEFRVPKPVSQVMHCNLYWSREHIVRERICAVPLLTTQPIPGTILQATEISSTHPANLGNPLHRTCRLSLGWVSLAKWNRSPKLDRGLHPVAQVETT